MKYRTQLLSIAAVLFALSLVIPAAQAEVLEAKGSLQWRRGNMHTHSHWSDGDDYLEMIASWYHDHDYQFLVFTDHNVLADHERWVVVEKSKGGRTAFDKLLAKYPQHVDQRTNDKGELEVRLRTFPEVANQLNKPGEFLLVQGEEISDHFEQSPIHLNASNVAELIAPMKGRSVFETIQNNVRAVLEQREKTGQPMIVHLNHPNFWYGITAEDLVHVRGEKFFEVYNGHNDVANAGDAQHASTERIWDIILTRRLAELGLPLMYGLATDDGHSYHNIPDRTSNPGRGWVMVLTKELTAKALIDALEAGQFYASSGVNLRRIEATAAALTVEVDPVAGETYKIDFIGTRQGYDPTSTPVTDQQGNPIRATRHYSDDLGQTLKSVNGPSATYQFTGNEIYVRARITSSAPHPNPSAPGDPQQAWTQPVVGPGVKGEK